MTLMLTKYLKFGRGKICMKHCCQRNIQKATMAFKCLLVYLSYLRTSKSRDSLNALQAEGL